MKIITLLENTSLQPELTAYPDTKFHTGHCTGKKAFGHLKELMKDRIFEFKTGTAIQKN